MKKIILVVDDDPAIRRIVNRALAGPDYEIMEAGDGDEIPPILAEHRVDLILLDLHMQRMDGLAALDLILEAKPNLPVIMITGDGDADHARRTIERGAVDYVVKPLDLEALKTTVMAYLLARE